MTLLGPVEIPPTPDDKGEIVEVQVLEEGKAPNVEEGAFDPDEFLKKLEHCRYSPYCPRCDVPMNYGSVPCPDGSIFEYYRCPTTRFNTKCYVTCPTKEAKEYLRRVKEQTHPCYQKIDPARFRCDCHKSLVLATSHSVNNPNRLYLKCPKRTCNFFQWINEQPRGMARHILMDN